MVGWINRCPHAIWGVLRAPTFMHLHCANATATFDRDASPPYCPPRRLACTSGRHARTVSHILPYPLHLFPTATRSCPPGSPLSWYRPDHPWQDAKPPMHVLLPPLRHTRICVNHRQPGSKVCGKKVCACVGIICHPGPFSQSFF